MEKSRSSSPFDEANCDECPLNHCTPVLPGRPKSTQTWTICAESPDKGDTKRMFGGAGGRLLDGLLKVAGLDRSQAHVTAAVLCRPKKKLSAKDWAKALSCCAPRLRAEYDSGIPRGTLALGANALKTLTGHAKINDWMGTPLPGAKAVKATPKRLGWPSFEDVGVFASVSPNLVIANKPLSDVLLNHLPRAYKFARYELPPWEWPDEVAPEYGCLNQDELDEYEFAVRMWKGCLGAEILSRESNSDTVHNQTPIEKYPEPKKVYARYGIANHAALEDALWRLMSAKELGCDVETGGIDPMRAELLNVGLASDTVAVSIDWPNSTAIERELCTRLVETKPLVMQNGQYDMLSLEANGMSVGNFVFDTLAAASVISPRLPKNLGFLCALHFWAPRWKTEFRSISDKAATNRFLTADPYERAVYNLRDTWMTLILAQQQRRALEKVHRGAELMEELMAVIHIAAAMRTRGIGINRERLAEMRATYRHKVATAIVLLRKTAREYGVTRFKPTRARDLQALFMDALEHEPVKRSEKTRAPSYDADALTQMLQDSDPRVKGAAANVLDYRRDTKYLKTYLTKVDINPDTNSVHATWNPTGAKTGRWSSQDPNLQNQPEDIQVIYVARPGLEFIECDYAQLELRVLALVANDKPLLDAFARGEDIHAVNAMTFFGKTDKKLRKMGKGVVFCMNYGGNERTAYAALSVKYPDITYSAVLTMFQRWKKAHPAIDKFVKRNMEQARRTGKIVEPLTGRAFNFYGDIEPTIVANFPIQTATMGIVNPAMRRLHARGESIIAQVHDSIICETEDRARTIAAMKEEMERPITLNGATMTFPVDVAVGTCLGEMAEWSPNDPSST